MSSQGKSEGVTLVLAAVLGIFGIMGIGHIYLGIVRRGVVILIGGIVLGAIAGALYMFIVPVIPFIALLVWSIYDAKKLYDKTVLG